jgi:hypothetical protein
MKSEIRKTESFTFAGSILFLVAVMGGCQRPPDDVKPTPKSDKSVQGEPFAEHWRQAMVELRKFRTQTCEPNIEPSRLIAIRERIRNHFLRLRECAREVSEKNFIQMTETGLDSIGRQLDNAVEAAERGDAARMSAASQEAGFILEEVAKLLTLNEK